jgi:ankyrin repeat protein
MGVNSADYDGRTALHLAASEGRLSVCQYLLDRVSTTESTTIVA